MKNLFLSIIVVLFAMFVVAGLVFAFTAPTAPPPDDNVLPPLNVSSLGQIKEGGLTLNTSGATNGLIVAQGNVGINDTTPDFKLDVDGSAGKPGGGSWSDASDERLKKNIVGIDGSMALEKIKQLRGVLFEWINPQEHTAGVRASVIAQELETVFPGWVESIDAEGKDKELIPEGDKAKATSFPHDFNAYLIEAIKEQQRQIEEQQAQIDQLGAELDELRGQIQ